MRREQRDRVASPAPDSLALSKMNIEVARFFHSPPCLLLAVLSLLLAVTLAVNWLLFSV